VVDLLEDLVLYLVLVVLRSGEQRQELGYGVHVCQHDQVLQLNGLVDRHEFSGAYLLHVLLLNHGYVNRVDGGIEAS